MPPTPTPTLNPSQTVERIREIIVGRHLEKLEARVARIESGTAPHGQIPSQWEDRLRTSEARLEALRQSVQNLADSSREVSEIHLQHQREEIQRLATQIQQVAALKTTEITSPSTSQIESKLNTWLTTWQGALQTHLTERDTRVTQQLRSEINALKAATDSQIQKIQNRIIDRDTLEERFSRIAAAARALAECALPECPAPTPIGTANSPA